MKKFNRREKFILKLMVATIGLWLFAEAWERYYLMKANLREDIVLKEVKNRSYLKELEGESVGKYTDQTEALSEELEDAHAAILELPSENDASLLLRRSISEKAEQAGLTINSISSRRSKPLGDSEYKDLKTYFNYESDLDAMLKFFDSMDNQGYYVIIDSLVISVRRQPRRTIKSKRPITRPEREPLNGNATLSTIFLANAEGSPERYLHGALENASTAVTPADIAPEKADEPVKEARPKPSAEPEGDTVLEEAEDANLQADEQEEEFDDEPLELDPAVGPASISTALTERNKNRQKPFKIRGFGETPEQKPPPLAAKPKPLTSTAKPGNKN